MAKTFALVIVGTLLSALLWLLAAAAGIGERGLMIGSLALFFFWVFMVARRGRETLPLPLRQAQAMKAKAARLPPLALADYRNLVAGLPAPSAQQQANFARFVSEAHSWYKHIPLCPPGTPFTFFLDPFAGCDRVVSPVGTLHFAQREKTGFHYSEIPTREYRERYGYLAFSCAERTKVFLVGPAGALVPGDDIAAVADRTGRLRALPPEASRAGMVGLTAAIHPHTAGMPWWDKVALGPTDDCNWPEESGGMETLQRIFERCRELRAAYQRDPEKQFEEGELSGELTFHFIDPTLYALLSPERERQQRAMVDAMGRAIALIHEPANRT